MTHDTLLDLCAKAVFKALMNDENPALAKLDVILEHISGFPEIDRRSMTMGMIAAILVNMYTNIEPGEEDHAEWLKNKTKFFLWENFLFDINKHMQAGE